MHVCAVSFVASIWHMLKSPYPTATDRCVPDVCVSVHFFFVRLPTLCRLRNLGLLSSISPTPPPAAAAARSPQCLSTTVPARSVSAQPQTSLSHNHLLHSVHLSMCVCVCVCVCVCLFVCLFVCLAGLSLFYPGQAQAAHVLLDVQGHVHQDPARAVQDRRRQAKQGVQVRNKCSQLQHAGRRLPHPCIIYASCLLRTFHAPFTLFF